MKIRLRCKCVCACVCVIAPRGTDGSQSRGDIYLLAPVSLLLMTTDARINQVESWPVLCVNANTFSASSHLSFP